MDKSKRIQSATNNNVTYVGNADSSRTSVPRNRVHSSPHTYENFTDYWNEYRHVEDILKDFSSEDSLDEEVARKSDDGEFESDWLRAAGFDFTEYGSKAAIPSSEVGEEALRDFLLPLTPSQATAVRKRVATLNATIRKKRHTKHRVPDVPDIFAHCENGNARSRSETPDSIDSISNSPPDTSLSSVSTRNARISVPLRRLSPTTDNEFEYHHYENASVYAGNNLETPELLPLDTKGASPPEYEYLWECHEGETDVGGHGDQADYQSERYDIPSARSPNQSPPNLQKTVLTTPLKTARRDTDPTSPLDYIRSTSPVLRAARGFAQYHPNYNGGGGGCHNSHRGSGVYNVLVRQHEDGSPVTDVECYWYKETGSLTHNSLLAKVPQQCLDQSEARNQSGQSPSAPSQLSLKPTPNRRRLSPPTEIIVNPNTAFLHRSSTVKERTRLSPTEPEKNRIHQIDKNAKSRLSPTEPDKNRVHLIDQSAKNRLSPTESDKNRTQPNPVGRLSPSESDKSRLLTTDQDKKSRDVSPGPLDGSLAGAYDSGLSESEASLDNSREELMEWGFDRRIGSVDNDDDFGVYCDRLGPTMPDDLCAGDFKKVQRFALISLAALFDTYSLPCNKGKPNRRRKKTEDNQVFGVPIQTLLDKDYKHYISSHRVPLIFQKLLAFVETNGGLKEEGILRVPGVQQKIQSLKQTIEKHFYSSAGQNGSPVDVALEQCSCNDVAALIKQFLRELPQPLLTYEFMDSFYNVDVITEESEQIKALKLLIILLPDAHRNTLWGLVQFLTKIVSLESDNKMGVQNVAMIIAPNLFLPNPTPTKKGQQPVSSSTDDLSREVNMAAATCRVTKMIIKYKDILWNIPQCLLKQVRQLNEGEMHRRLAKENHGPMRWLLSRKSPKADNSVYRRLGCEEDFREGIIRVQAPQFTNQPVVIKLFSDSNTTYVVNQIVQTAWLSKSALAAGARGDNRRRALLEGNGNSESKPKMTSCMANESNFEELLKTHVLYEVGGNIGERRLHSKAILLDVYRANPNAEWQLKCRHPRPQTK